MRLYLTAAMILLATPLAAQHAPPPFGFDDAVRIGTAAVDRARTSGTSICAVVVNREGRVLVALRMDGCSFVNLEVAEAKAVTAAALGIKSGLLGQAVDAGKPSLLSVRGLSPIGGGVPVMRAGATVAGIGVSGGTPEEDEAVATIAAAAQTTGKK